MSRLKENELECIRLDVIRQRVTYSHLLEDLVDHVCCDVEAEMDEGYSFSQAYEKVRSKMGVNRLKRIQEETIMLIDKNYKSMKTFMKIFGALSPSLLAVAALFKIQHWPGAGIMLVLGFFFLCFFFLPSAIYVLNAENKTDKKRLFMKLSGLIAAVTTLLGILFKVNHWPWANIALIAGLLMLAFLFLPAFVVGRISDDKGEGKRTAYLVGLFAGLFYITGFLFKLMHWPGASVLILMGLLLFGMVFFPLFVYAQYRNESQVSGHYIFINVASMMAILFLSFMALSVSKDFLSGFIMVENRVDTVLHDLTEKNNGLVREMANTSEADEVLVSVHRETNALVSWIDDLKSALVIATEPENRAAIAGGKIDFSALKKKDENNIPAEILITGGKGRQLSEKITEYKEYLLSRLEDPDLPSKLEQLLDVTKVRIADDAEIPWEDATFGHHSFVSILNTLTIIQIELRLAEKEFLKRTSEHAAVNDPHKYAKQTDLI